MGERKRPDSRWDPGGRGLEKSQSVSPPRIPAWSPDLLLNETWTLSVSIVTRSSRRPRSSFVYSKTPSLTLLDQLNMTVSDQAAANPFNFDTRARGSNNRVKELVKIFVKAG